MLRILPALRPEGAADVARDDADLVLGDPEDVARQRVAHAVRVLDVGVQGVPLLAGVPDAERAPRLHELRVHARDHVAAADHARRPREGRVGGRPVAGLEDVGDVVGTLVPHRRAAGRRGVRRPGHGRQRLVLDPDQLGRVLGLRVGLRDHQRDGVADVSHPVRGEAAMRRGEHRRAVGTLARERHRHRAEPVAREVGAREHREDAGRRRGRGRIDRPDPRVGVHRAHDDGVGLAGKVHVRVEAALAAQEPDVLEPLDPLSDPELPHYRTSCASCEMLMSRSSGAPVAGRPRRERSCSVGAVESSVGASEAD